MRGTWRSHARIAALALFFLAAAGAARTATAANQILVGVDKVRFAWQPPSGTIAGYMVSRSLNGSALQSYAVATAPNVDIPVAPGDRLLVAVSAFAYSSSGALIAGPQSAISDRVDVVSAPRFPVPGSWLLRCASCPTVVRRSLADASVVQGQATGPASAWRSLGRFVVSGRSQIIWQHSTTGQIVVWDEQTLAATPGGIGVAPIAVRGIGGVDLDGDGREEFLMQRTDTNQVSVWSLLSTGFEAVATLPGPAGAVLAAARDLDGDGKIDLLWRDPTLGTLERWSLKSDPRVSSALSALYQLPATRIASGLAADATVVSTGDYDGDGYPDVLWRYANGQLAISYLTAGKLKRYVALPLQLGDVDFDVVGSLDIDGVPGDEIALQHRTKKAIVVLDPKQTSAPVRVTVLTPGSKWKVLGIDS